MLRNTFSRRARYFLSVKQLAAQHPMLRRNSLMPVRFLRRIGLVVPATDTPIAYGTPDAPFEPTQFINFLPQFADQDEVESADRGSVVTPERFQPNDPANNFAEPVPAEVPSATAPATPLALFAPVKPADPVITVRPIQTQADASSDVTPVTPFDISHTGPENTNPTPAQFDSPRAPETRVEIAEEMVMREELETVQAAKNVEAHAPTGITSGAFAKLVSPTEVEQADVSGTAIAPNLNEPGEPTSPIANATVTEPGSTATPSTASTTPTPNVAPNTDEGVAGASSALATPTGPQPNRPREYRRARIEELRPTAKPSAPALPVQTPNLTQKPAPNPLPASAAPETDLFQDRENLDRSPAAWAARLMRVAAREAGRALEPNVPAPAAMPAKFEPGSAPTSEAKLQPRPVPQPTTSPSETPGSAATPAVATSASATPTTPVTPTSLSASSLAVNQLQPQIVPDTTRRFLKPLLGFDPADALVYAGEEAARLTAEQQADAMTVDEAVVIGAEQLDESPEHLGLLAHELTHVSQRRQPRFVPPILRSTSGMSIKQDPPTGVAPSTSFHSFNLPVNASATFSDEELLAQGVEQQVIAVAREAQGLWIQPSQAINISSPPIVRSVVPAQPDAEVASSMDWGGLPAPWQPLPDWLTVPTAEPAAEPASAGLQWAEIGMASRSAPATTTGNVTSSMATEAPATAAPVTAQRAERSRNIESSGAEGSSTVARTTVEPIAPTPDLDALARQVYAALKRRLAAEHRRELF